MGKGRTRFAAILAGAATLIYLVIQLIFGAEAGEAAIRALIFAVVIFLISLAIDWDKRARPKEPQAEESSKQPPSEPPAL